MYRIREVEGDDDDIADTLAELHSLTFFRGAPVPGFDQAHSRWRASDEFHDLCSFAGMGAILPGGSRWHGDVCRVGRRCAKIPVTVCICG